MTDTGNKVISIKKRQKDAVLKELGESLKTVQNYFVVAEVEEALMCYHTEMDIEKLLVFQKILNLYIDDCFRQAAEYEND